VRVVAGALFDRDGRVLIAQRPVGKPHAGRWEFPGGKIGAGESEAAALARELREEIGVEVQRAESLMTLVHDYPERRVELHLHIVLHYRGSPASLDRQRLKWVPLASLQDEDLLEADAPFVRALQHHRASAT
jgi:8-oxo-dGTP diphosphatase